MKAVKIILAVAVVGIISFFAWKWWQPDIPPLSDSLPPPNEFVTRVQRRIDSLKTLPTNLFCREVGKEIHDEITKFYEGGLLDKNRNYNEQRKENLSAELYTAYALKFIDQAAYVFDNSEWKITNLNIIRKGIDSLLRSPYLDPNREIAGMLKDHKGTLAKYDEIVNFIASCNDSLHFSYEIEEIFEAGDKIKKADHYINSNMDGSKVQNCPRIEIALKKIPNTLFDKHISYLDTKIRKHGEAYKDTTCQYRQTIVEPLKTQIDNISDIYQAPDAKKIEDLEELLNRYSTAARNYKNNH